MDAGARLGYGPLEAPAKAMPYVFNQVLPASNARLPRQRPRHVAAGQSEVTTGVQRAAAGHARGRWRLHRRKRCPAPVSWLACEGIRGRDDREASMWSWRSPFMSACDPLIQAERRCKTVV